MRELGDHHADLPEIAGHHRARVADERIAW
jgi:hypothetical protein